MDARLEEYRQLSAEIRHYFERRRHTIYFAITITFGVVGVSIKFGVWPLPILSTILIAFLWLEEIMRVKAVFRASAYIQVFIEDDISGLKWNTTGDVHKIRHSLRRLFSNGILPVLYLANMMPLILLLDSRYAALYCLKIVYMILISTNNPVLVSTLILTLFKISYYVQFFFLIGVPLLCFVFLLKLSYETFEDGRENEVEFYRQQKKLYSTAN